MQMSNYFTPIVQQCQINRHILSPLWPPVGSRVHHMMQGNENKCSSMLGLISFSSYDDQGLCGAEARRHCCPSHMIAQVHTKTQNHSPAFFFSSLPFISLAFSSPCLQPVQRPKFTRGTNRICAALTHTMQEANRGPLKRHEAPSVCRVRGGHASQCVAIFHPPLMFWTVTFEVMQ